jgi:hypothetical protein
MLPDGLDELMSVLDIRTTMSLIEKTARWVSLETFSYLPVWYPEHARGALFYKENWSAPQMNTNRESGVSVHKREGNTHANKALTYAFGLNSGGRKNWSCCHIWGVDDARFQSPNRVVQDPRFFSCVGNMVLLPTPLKAFTDSVPEVQTMLRICARNLYGWSCDHSDIESQHKELDQWQNWDVYPGSWPRKIGQQSPKGTVAFSTEIKTRADRRKSAVFRDIHESGEFYPRDNVSGVLAYWDISE